MRKLSKAFFLLFLTSLFSFGQLEYERKMNEILCSDSIFGRGYVNQGDNRAARFLSNEFQSIGLLPILKDNSYTQPFEVQVNSFPSNPELLIGEYSLAVGTDYLPHPASGLFSGDIHPFIFNAKNPLDQSTIELALQKIQQQEVNTLVFDTEELGISTIDAFVYEVIELSQVVNLFFLTTAKLSWAVSEFATPFALISIGKKHWNTEEAIHLNIENKVVDHYSTENVLGYIPSASKAEETIVICAHYDHLGGIGTEAFFPGANDNASGTTMLLTLAKHFLANPTEYNLLFIAFSGEEVGLKGSYYFVENSPVDLEKIEFVLNLDIMGSGEDGITVVNGKIHQEAFELLHSLNEKNAYLTQVKARGETKNSDHYPFYKNGVPAFFIYTMGENQNYHDVFDVAEAITFYAYENIIQLLVNFIEQL